ncbi:hypothetical protein EG329_009661 [Mollisiaceae sp. DMI_Dod_QoI]|nr:hypothetical protein EG329_009661 [Helotiales sp. DMI_Dod_QoI]
MLGILELILVCGLCVSLSHAFENPIRKPGADPSMVTVNGTYYMTTTGGDHIAITKSQTLGGLLKGETRTVWTDTNPTRNTDMWAPEMHQIDNTWYMFYSSGGTSTNTSNRCRVLKGCSGPNPYDCNYIYLAELTPPVGKQAGPNKDDPHAIDGTYLVIGKKRYSVVSANDENSEQSISITELDTEKWTVSGWHIISEPNQPWERNTTNSASSDVVAVNEGPHPLYHGGEVWLTYSGSFCGTPNYALGLLHYIGGDPLSRSSWVKKGPVLSQANGNYGTGHNCFFKSPDGTQIWNGFHATANPKGNCGNERYVMAQIVEWDEGNTPSFGIPQPLSAVIQPPSGERVLKHRESMLGSSDRLPDLRRRKYI